jgi:hypothetical protein
VDHHRLLDLLAPYVRDRALLNLVWQYCTAVTDMGQLHPHPRGIPKGCPLSPLVGEDWPRTLEAWAALREQRK